jgi:hypothetical protein
MPASEKKKESFAMLLIPTTSSFQHFANHMSHADATRETASMLKKFSFCKFAEKYNYKIMTIMIITRIIIIFFFFYWAPAASAPRSTAACRLIVRARLWKFPLVPPGAPSCLQLCKDTGNGREMSGEFCHQIAHSMLFEGIFYMPHICDMGLTALLPPEKSNSFSQVRTRELGYQRPAC